MNASVDKQVWLLAGGNGAGKSTFYKKYLEPRGMPFINADLIAKELSPSDPVSASYDASQWAAQMRQRFLAQGASFCFETVFSHTSKIDFLAEAKALGYQVVVIYIHLNNDELNQARVTQRVTEGGHFVPSEKIVSRIPRTIANIRTAIPLADHLRILNNSSKEAPFETVAILQKGVVVKAVSKIPTWAGNILEGYLLPKGSMVEKV